MGSELSPLPLITTSSTADIGRAKARSLADNPELSGVKALQRKKESSVSANSHTSRKHIRC